MTMESREKNRSSSSFKPSWRSLEKKLTPTWFKDAKFGIYTHWGVYSVPACGPNGTWYPHNMYREGTPQYEHHVETYGPPEEFGYKEFIPDFTGEKFDAEEWAELFDEAGAEFAGPVAEHHDGFSMWDSELTKWNAARMGPGRDVVGELSRAIKERGMKFMTAFHHAANWWFFPVWEEKFDCSDPAYSGLYGPRHEKVERTGPHPTGPKPGEEYLDNWLEKLKEVVEGYDPDMIWFDFAIGLLQERYPKEFLAYYYNKGLERERDVVITHKGHAAGLPPSVEVLDLELGKMADLTYHYWITDSSVDDQGAWSYVEEAGFKSTKRLVTNLVDRVSKNGSLLLNVGPRADGTIPEEAQQRMREMGDWLEVNGEAIYGTRAWTLPGEGPTEEEEGGAFSEVEGGEGEGLYTAEDVRFTAKEEALYAIFLGWPIPDGAEEEEEVKVESFKRLYEREIESIELLGVPGQLDWEMKEDGLSIQLPPLKPEERPCKHAYTVKVTTG